ncbi:MAG: pyridoxal kinase PdxY [Acetobacteraceae bacterium]|nr:pyridoxal kinase PdxY [Acetobacteraceae bacterium]MSP29795.1 pyridoxal kinase PdxY [Acetobacteraceae bacterium]
MNILSIQSWVAYGHVGNASAVFPLQRLGAEVHAIHTVQFSNHTGYGDWTGDVFSGAQVGALVDGVARRGALSRCDAVLSGYMGDVGIGHAILDAVKGVRAANPHAIYCCDPVIGDDAHGVYVRPGIAELMRDAVIPAADIATPNAFELRQLTGLPDTTLAQAKQAIAALQARMYPAGPRTVLLTSLRTDATPADCLDMLVGEGGKFYLLRSPLLPVDLNGAGDAVAALFLFHRIVTGSAVAALEAAGSAIHGVLRRTAEAGSRELLMVAAQEEFVNPSIRLTAEPV